VAAEAGSVNYIFPFAKVNGKGYTRGTSWHPLSENWRTSSKRIILTCSRNERTFGDDHEGNRPMPVDIDLENLPPFPTRLNGKLKAIRERLHLSPDEFAPLVGVASGEAIECYEKELGDDLHPLLVTTLLKTCGMMIAICGSGIA
jgi:hypothetical protein